MNQQFQYAESDKTRVTLVTGGTDGIGRAVALELARRGHRILFAGRDASRGAEVLDALRRIGPGVEHEFLPTDLARLSETARLAQTAVQRSDRLDAVVCCAGILSTVPEWTEEGLERNFVLNYLSRYLLVRALLPLLERGPSGRIVLVSNAGKYADTLDLDDLQCHRAKPGLSIAGRTQFANDSFAFELSERLRGTRLEVSCVFPGVVKTSVFRNARGLPKILRLIASGVQQLFGQSPEAAAQTPVFLAQSPAARGTTGSFYGPRCKPLAIPGRVRREDRRSALWKASEALVQPYLDGMRAVRRPDPTLVGEPARVEVDFPPVR